MEVQSLIYVGIIVGAVPVILILFQVIPRVWNFLYEILRFKNLSIRVIGRTSLRGKPNIMIKVALVGKEDVIVNEVSMQSKLLYPSRFEGFLEWWRLGIAYVLDDVEGLNTVLGKSSPYIGLMALPFHRIDNAYIRKPFSVLWGAIILSYSIIFLFPPFLPVLFWGPYQELRLVSGNEEVKLSEQGSKVELERPFILKPGFEKCFTISYGSSSLYYAFFWSKVILGNAKISYVKEPSKLRGLRLPRSNEFIWKANGILKVNVCGKVRKYPVELGDSYVKVKL
jgi:hypothetical protein